MFDRIKNLASGGERDEADGIHHNVTAAHGVFEKVVGTDALNLAREAPDMGSDGHSLGKVGAVGGAGGVGAIGANLTERKKVIAGNVVRGELHEAVGGVDEGVFEEETDTAASERADPGGDDTTDERDTESSEGTGGVVIVAVDDVEAQHVRSKRMGIFQPRAQTYLLPCYPKHMLQLLTRHLLFYISIPST